MKLQTAYLQPREPSTRHGHQWPLRSRWLRQPSGQKGRYDGAYTVSPKYLIGLNVRKTDVGFFDVHVFHGNTEIVKHGDCERISAVCYVREKMIKCGSAKEELNIALERDKWILE